MKALGVLGNIKGVPLEPGRVVEVRDELADRLISGNPGAFANLTARPIAVALSLAGFSKTFDGRQASIARVVPCRECHEPYPGNQALLRRRERFTRCERCDGTYLEIIP